LSDFARAQQDCHHIISSSGQATEVGRRLLDRGLQAGGVRKIPEDACARA
jgi:hypothetical protein